MPHGHTRVGVGGIPIKAGCHAHATNHDSLSLLSPPLRVGHQTLLAQLPTPKVPPARPLAQHYIIAHGHISHASCPYLFNLCGAGHVHLPISLPGHELKPNLTTMFSWCDPTQIPKECVQVARVRSRSSSANLGCLSSALKGGLCLSVWVF